MCQHKWRKSGKNSHKLTDLGDILTYNQIFRCPMLNSVWQNISNLFVDYKYSISNSLLLCWVYWLSTISTIIQFWHLEDCIQFLKLLHLKVWNQYLQLPCWQVVVHYFWDNWKFEFGTEEKDFQYNNVTVEY